MPTLHPRSQLAACAAAVLLAACGGGSGGSNTATPLTLAGTAATGAAIAGATVEAKCANGTGSATTQADGRYSIEIASGSLPCVLAVRPATGAVLHSAIDGSGAASVNVNITPLSELVVAKLAAGAPSDLFTNFDAAAQAKITAAALDAAIAAVTVALQGAVDLAGINPIKDPLVAANASTAGNTLDQKLDQLQARLAAANLRLAQLAEAVAGGGSTLSALRNTLGCPGVRSGRYVDLSLSGNEDAPLFYDFDAATLTASLGGTEPVVLTALGDCRYSSVNDNSHETVVATSGIHVTASTRTDPTSPVFGKTDLSLGLPLQTIALAELAGTWNGLEYFRDPVKGQPTFAPNRMTFTLDADGNATLCEADGRCVASRPEEAMRPNAAGGFDIGDDDPIEGPSRVFAFKSADGHLSLYFMYSTRRGFIVFSKPTPLALPAVGDSARVRDFTFGADGYLFAPPVDLTTTIIGIDTAAGSYTRIRASDSRIDSFTINTPQPGFRTRAANSCTIGSASVGCTGLIAMPLLGTGISVYTSVAPQNFFGITVAKP